MITVYLLGMTSGTSSKLSRKATEALWVDMESLIRIQQDLYPFAVIDSIEELRALLRPFKTTHVVEVSATPGRLVFTPQPQFGFTKADPGQSQAMDLPPILTGRLSPMGPLLDALTRQRHPMQIVLRLTPEALDETDRLLIDGVRHALVGDSPGLWRIERPGRRPSSASPVSGQPLEQAIKSLSGLGDHYSFHALIESVEPLPRPLRMMIADALFGGHVGDPVYETWPEESILARRRHWGFDLPPQTGGQKFRYVRSAATAWPAFRLPLAGDGPVAGLDSIPISHGYCPEGLPTEGIRIGEKRTPSTCIPIRQNEEDRLRHTYILGQTGTGKSSLLGTMAIQDIDAGRGVTILDPHGDLIQEVLGAIPPHRAKDVILFDLTDARAPLGLNPLEYDRQFPQQRTFFINELITIFDELYDLKKTGGPIFENYMRNSLLLLMGDSQLQPTLLDLSRVFVDKTFRRELLDRTQDEMLHLFWKQAVEAGGEASLANIAPYITSKLTQFVSDDVLRPIISQPHSAFDFRQVMDDGRILLVNLAKGYVGNMTASLLGMILVARLFAAALSRATAPPGQRRIHFLYVDEFQNFTSRTIPQLLAEVRKYRLGLVLANQNLQQLRDETLHAVLGNVGTTLFFRPGPLDAEKILPYVEPTFEKSDLISLPNFAIVGRLLVDNAPTTPFLFNTAWQARGDRS